MFAECATFLKRFGTERAKRASCSAYNAAVELDALADALRGSRS